MKINIKSGDAAQSAVWKVLVVDDDNDVHSMTRIFMKTLEIYGRKVEIVSAMSGTEAREIMNKKKDLAVALIDVVMETDTAGLDLVKYIREELGNANIRIIIRTGQPGIAPERFVIENYDIDDYRDKTELVAQKFFTMMRTSIKSYKDIMTIDKTKSGLEKILNAAPELYSVKPIEQFFEIVLAQIESLYNLETNNFPGTISGFLATMNEEDNLRVHSCTGKFAEVSFNGEVKALLCKLKERIKSDFDEWFYENSILIPIYTENKLEAIVYFEEASEVVNGGLNLIKLMVNQCSAALKNLKLYKEIEDYSKDIEIKNRMLGMAAHDLKNPLGVISSLVEILETKNIDNDFKSSMGYIKTCSRHALSIVSNLLDFSRFEAGKMMLEFSHVEVPILVEDVIRLNKVYSETKKIKIQTGIAEHEKIYLSGDYNKLKQVLSNLVNNALKYSPENSNVKISVESKDENNILFLVKDEGLGIPVEYHNKLFMPFSRTTNVPTANEPSAGLGLLICKKIVEAHGGRIWFESTPGKGSTFYFSVPAVPVQSKVSY